jgi:hypothetical protein
MHTPRPFLSAILTFSLLSFLQSRLLGRDFALLPKLGVLIPMQDPMAIGTQGNALGCRLVNRLIDAPIGHQAVDLSIRLVPHYMMEVNHRRMRKATMSTRLRLLELYPKILAPSLVSVRPGLVLRSIVLVPTL